EIHGDRLFSLFVGLIDGSIMAHLLSRAISAPLPHDLLDSAIRALGGNVVSAEIVGFDANANACMARLRLQREREILLINCRASDAVSVAIASKTPFLVPDEILSE